MNIVVETGGHRYHYPNTPPSMIWPLIDALEEAGFNMDDTKELARAREQRDKLCAALAGLIGAESEEELRAMEATIRFVPAPDADKAAMLNAIHVLLEVWKERGNQG